MYIRYEGITLGGRTGPLIISDFDAPTTDLRSSFTDRINRDGVMVSREWLGKASWQFTISTNGDSLREALDTAGALESVWKRPSVRNSTAPAVLEYSYDGENWYRILGRPGRFTSLKPDVHATLGVGVLDIEFVQTDPRHFASTEASTRINAVPASIGGIVAPVISPITTVASGGARAGRIINSGDLPAPVTVTFYGPSTNPKVRTSEGYEIAYNGTLAHDRSVTIDPLNHSVTMDNGVQVPGRLSRRTRLSSLTVPPGSSDWFYEATDATGSSYVELSYRDSYSHMR